MFNWQRFLDQHHIEYTDRGRNVSKGNLAIKCPMCTDDPTMHMNVSLKGYGYACWRDAKHRGKNNAKLVHRLLNCSWAEAVKIVGGDIEVPTDDDFASRISNMLNGTSADLFQLKLPADWKKLADPSSSMHRNFILEYIHNRNYSPNAVLQLATRYDIHYATKDNWDRRVLWPLRNEKGQLVNYTGRAISANQKIRYKTLTGDQAGARMSECLFDLHTLARTKGSALVVTEGPFDAMRLGRLGEPLGIYATCVFTQNVSDTQSALLTQLAYRFDRSFVLFDEGAELQSFRAASNLGFERIKLPSGVKDPDTLNSGQALALCRQLVSN